MNYHYSTILHLGFVLLSQELLPSRRNAHGDHKEGLLWFSDNSAMEMTALKGDVDMIRFGSRHSGIGNWQKVGRQVGYGSSVIRRLEKSGRKMGARPSEWKAMRGELSLTDVEVIELKGALGWQKLDRAALRVERLESGLVQLIGPKGLAAIVGRKRTPEGYYAYATNRQSYWPDNLVDGRPLRKTG